MSVLLIRVAVFFSVVFAPMSLGFGSDGASAIRTIVANLRGLEKFEVEYVATVAGIDTAKRDGVTFDLQIKGRLFVDRAERRCVFGTSTAMDSSTTKVNSGNAEENSRVSVQLFSHEGGVSSIHGAGEPKKTVEEFSVFLKRNNVPLLEFSGLSKFPLILRGKSMEDVYEKITLAFSDSNLTDIGSGKSRINITREDENVRLVTTATIDPVSLMAESFTLVEQDKKGSGEDIIHLKLSTNHIEANGLFLPEEVEFENREFLPSGQPVHAFGNIKLRWLKVNEELSFPDLGAFSTASDVLRFINESAN